MVTPFGNGRRRAARGLVELLAAVGIGFTTAGCAETVKQHVSVPERVPAGVAASISDDIIRLTVEDVSIAVQMQNYWRAGLGVWLSLEARGEGWSFDPGRVALASKTGAGESLTPVEFLGPDKPWHSPRAFGMGCGPRRYSVGWALVKIDVTRALIRRPAGAVPFSGLSCFMLWFGTDPSPARGFVLSIEGLRNRDRPLLVPALHYRAGLVQKLLIP